MMMQAAEKMNIGEMVMHHAGDAHEIDFEPLGTIHLPVWDAIHLGPLTLDLSPTRHVVFMIVAAVLVFLTMWLTGRALVKQGADRKAPKGFAGAVEGLVLYVRDDVVFAAMGRANGARFVPLILTFFFFILYGNLLGLLPWGAAFTSNIGVTVGLALITFLVVEIAGMRKLGFSGYMGTIFPHIDGMGKGGATTVSLLMGPVELLGKLTKPLALALRLFGNILAGHFVVLSFLGLIFMFGHMPGINWGVGIGTTLLVVAVMLLEVIVSLVQAYVFALLSATFIGMMQEHH